MNYDTMTTWRKELIKTMDKVNDSVDNIIFNTMTDEEMDREFDSESFDCPYGIPFTIWTKDNVYFPESDRITESVKVVSRNPNGLPMRHWSN